jgi:hypothetical protein
MHLFARRVLPFFSVSLFAVDCLRAGSQRIGSAKSSQKRGLGCAEKRSPSSSRMVPDPVAHDWDKLRQLGEIFS